MTRSVCLVMLLLRIEASHAQEAPPIVQQQLEARAESLEEQDEDGITVLEQLAHLSKNPLDLNRASAEDLQALPFLTDLQIAHFLRYRRLLGLLVSIYELQAVPTWDLSTIRKALPYVTVLQHIPAGTLLRERLRGGEHYLLLRTAVVPEKQKGFDRSSPGHFLGSRPSLLIRYRYTHKNNLQYGFTAEKDSGEPFFKGAQKLGFDFYSAHFFARNLGRFAAVALGDFTVNIGQGLVQWQTLAFTKSADVTNVKRQAPLLKPYTGVGEAAFNRGAGATWRNGSFEATAFLSSRLQSATTATSGSTGETAISGFLTSGLHRTDREIRNRHSVRQTTAGISLRWVQPMLEVGVHAVHNHLSKQLIKRDEPYNRFALQGKRYLHYSFDYSFTYRNSHVFGELAFNGRGTAALGGVLVAAHPKADIAFVCRRIDPWYATLSGNAFTEAALPSNERGWYTAITLRPAAHLTVAMYADHYSFPYIRYGVHAPSSGRDYLLQINATWKKHLDLSLRLKAGEKSNNETAGNAAIRPIGSTSRSSIRCIMNYRLSAITAVKCRADMLWLKEPGKIAEEGFLLSIEADQVINRSLSFNMRVLFFDTDSYNSRLYAFETDVPYAATIAPSFHTGFRYYMNLSCKAGKRWNFWARWAQTVHSGMRSFGTGTEQVEGPVRSEIKVQVRYNF